MSTQVVLLTAPLQVIMKADPGVNVPVAIFALVIFIEDNPVDAVAVVALFAATPLVSRTRQEADEEAAVAELVLKDIAMALEAQELKSEGTNVW